LIHHLHMHSNLHVPKHAQTGPYAIMHISKLP
jgi:hypothetical protein